MCRQDYKLLLINPCSICLYMYVVTVLPNGVIKNE